MVAAILSQARLLLQMSVSKAKAEKMNKHNMTGLIIWLFVIVSAALLSGTRIPMLINLPAALFVALGMTGAVLFTNFPSQRSVLRWRAAAYGAWYSGIIVFVVAMVGLLNNLSDPSTIGPNVSVSLISILYGAAAALVCHLISLKKSP